MKKLVLDPLIENELTFSSLFSVLDDDRIYNYKFEEEEVQCDKINGIEFNGCTFNKLKIFGIPFYNNQFVDVVFTNCDFSNSLFELCSFVRCSFVNCKLLGVNFLKCSFHNVKFNCPMQYSNFANNKMKKVLFEKSSLVEGRFFENTFSKIYFNNCVMIRIEFVKCDLEGIDLSTNNIDDIRINTKELRGVIVNSYQACLFARMLGVIIEG